MAWLCLHPVPPGSHEDESPVTAARLGSVSFTITISQLALEKTPISLEAQVFSVCVTAHMGLQGYFLSANWKWWWEGSPYHTRFSRPCSQSLHYWDLYLLLGTGEK